jgi:iron complex outermembrane receptor protein
MKHLKYALLCTTASLMLGTSFAAYAQQGGGLEEIVVTAQRRTERLEEVPASVLALSPDTIQKNNVVSFMDLSKIASGVQLNFSGSVPVFAIRGISTLVTGYNVGPDIGVYVDGFYNPQPMTMDSDMANLESLQVLKGPQGTLYGVNATGGAILINTRSPSKTFQGSIDLSYGRFNDKTANVFVSGPINDRIRYSVSGHYRENDGWTKLIDPTNANRTISNKALPYKQGQVRVKVEDDITDDFNALLGFAYGYTQDNRSSRYSPMGHPSAAILAVVHPIAFNTTAYDFPTNQYAMTYEETLKLTWKTGIGELHSYTGYTDMIYDNRFDFDGTYAPYSANHLKYDQHTFQELVDYNITAINNLDLVVGGMYINDRFQHRPGYGIMVFVGNALFLNQFQHQRTESWAAYVDGTYHITDRLSLDVGGRFSSDKIGVDWRVTNATGGFILAPVADSHKWTKFTPRGTLRYELAPRTNVYASVSTGYHSGDYNGGAPSSAAALFPVNPETITAYEVGFKTAQGKVRLDSSFFYYDYKNFQVSAVVPISPCAAGAGNCGVTSILQNAPKAEVYGWDSDITFNPVDNLNIHAGLVLMKGRYKNFHNASGNGVDATNTLSIANQLQDWSNLRMVRAPDVSGNIGIDYTVPLSTGSLLLSTNVSYTSTFPLQNPSVGGPLAPTDLQHKQIWVQTSYALLGASATWTDSSDRYTVSIYGDNLTNHTYRLDYNGGSFGDYSAMAEPISYGNRVGAKF